MAKGKRSKSNPAPSSTSSSPPPPPSAPPRSAAPSASASISDAPSSAESRATALRRARSGLLAALVVVVLIVVGYTALHRSPASRLAASVPADVALFIEFPSVSRALSAAAAMKVVDPAKASVKQATDEASRAVAAAFGLEQVDAEALDASVVGVALAARVDGAAVHYVALATFSKPSALDPLFASTRLTTDGPFAGVGQAYRVVPQTTPQESSGIEKSLRELSTSAPGQKLVWFPRSRLLAMGDEALVHDIADVLASGKPALERRDLFTRARESLQGGASDGAEGSIFVDEEAWKRAPALSGQAKVLDAYWHGGGSGGAVGAAVRFVPAGVLVRGAMGLSGAAMDALPAGTDPTPTLSFADRLPAETAAYVDVSTRHRGSSADAKAALTKLFEASQLASYLDLAKDVTGFGQDLGITADDVLEMAGDELVVALLLEKDFRLGGPTPLMETGLRSTGLVLALKVDGDAAAQRVITKLREAIDHSAFAHFAHVAPEADGFVVALVPQEGEPAGASRIGLRVKYAKKEVELVVGRPELTNRVFAALNGGMGTLKDDPAHALAMKALKPGLRAYAWADVGRLASRIYEGNPSAKEHAKALGLPVDPLLLAGPSRVTSAVGLDVHVKAGEGSLDFEALNPWAAGLFAGWRAPPPLRHHTPALAPVASASATPAPSGSAVLGSATAPAFPDALDEMPQCRELLKTYERCASKTETAEARAAYLDDAAKRRREYLNTAPGMKRVVAEKLCFGPLFKLKKKPECK